MKYIYLQIHKLTHATPLWHIECKIHEKLKEKLIVGVSKGVRETQRVTPCLLLGVFSLTYEFLLVIK